MKLLAFCLLLGMSAQAQNIPWDSTGAVTACYARYSGLCQTSPLTAAEKAADEVEKQIDGLLLELGDRRDLSAADVLYIGETTRRRMFNGGEELLKNLQQIKKRAERAAQRAADETGPLGDGPNPPWPPYEPMDVPAVLHKHIIVTNLGTCSNSWAKCIPGRDVTKTIWTCADKSRILEHDENSPPKYWCRKVEF